MIPKNISFESVIKALGLIDKKGIPEDRHSVKYSLEHEGILYPPKYVISIANMFENNEEWLPENFSGGRETNQFLEELGFKIINVGSEPFDYPFESHSWKAISDSVAIKILDKSAFLHHGSGIPRDFKFYFGLDNFNIDEPKNIIFIHRNNHFDATFQMDKPLKRLRLFWKSDFAEVLKKTFPEWYRSFSQDVEWESERPEMRFQKLRESEYQIDFIHPEKINLDIESETAEDELFRSEGAAKYVYSKRYERDPVNRRKAIEIHGLSCSICGFDFESVYGDRGKGFIEIHHTKPLSKVDEEVYIDPETDLMPVCSNCHRMIHRRKDDVLDIEKMIKLYFYHSRQ